MILPPKLDAAIEEAWGKMSAAPGFLTEREGRFLCLTAACAPAVGTILEIGSFQGKSTVGLAAIAARYDLGKVVSVDPHTAPAVTDPDLKHGASSYDDFLRALQRAGAGQQVEAHRTTSRELSKDWNRPIRLLWIDGDHTYAGSKEDFDLFRPHLAEGAVVALHDVLNAFEGPVRVFVEDLLRSDDFGPAGVCGSIGWAQLRPKGGAQFNSRKKPLARKLERLIPLVRGGSKPTGIRKLQYKFRRALVPRSAPDPATWVAAVSSYQ